MHHLARLSRVYVGGRRGFARVVPLGACCTRVFFRMPCLLHRRLAIFVLLTVPLRLVTIPRDRRASSGMRSSGAQRSVSRLFLARRSTCSVASPAIVSAGLVCPEPELAWARAASTRPVKAETSTYNMDQSDREHEPRLSPVGTLISIIKQIRVVQRS